MIYGQNVSASFLCLSCPALVLVLIMCTSSLIDLSKINDDDDDLSFYLTLIFLTGCTVVTVGAHRLHWCFILTGFS